MSIKYRPHRATLAESMEEEVCVETLTELIDVIVKTSCLHSRPSHIEFEFEGHDRRNGWDTWTVIADGKALGYSDGIIVVDRRLTAKMIK